MKTDNDIVQEYLRDPENPTPEVQAFFDKAAADTTDWIEDKIAAVTANSERSKSESPVLRSER